MVISLLKNKYFPYLFFTFSLTFVSVLILKYSGIGIPFGLFIGIILSILLLFALHQDIPYLLVWLSIFPLFIINDVFSRYFNFIILQNLPLTLLLIIFLFSFCYKAGKREFQIFTGYLSIPILSITVVNIFLALLGIINNAPRINVINEFYQNFYFFFFFPIIFFINEREKYFNLIKLVIFIFILISIQYVLFNLIRDGRYLSYHMHFLPVVLSILFADFLLSKKRRLMTGVGIIIVWLGSIYVQTRLLWIANLLSMFIVGYLVFLQKKKWIFKKKYSLIIAIPIILVGLYLAPKIINTNISTINYANTTEQKVESIANPLSDLSFLLRVEAVLNGIKKILNNPIFGEGYGHTLKLEIFFNTEYIYPDNSFIYFAWKGGFIFLSLYLWLYYRSLKSSYLIIKNSDNLKIRIIMIGFFASFIAILFYGNFSANMIGFKMNLLYTIMFSYVEFERQKLLLINA